MCYQANSCQVDYFNLVAHHKSYLHNMIILKWNKIIEKTEMISVKLIVSIICSSIIGEYLYYFLYICEHCARNSVNKIENILP